MKDLRQGRCPLCSHDEIIESMAAEFIGIAETHRKAVERWQCTCVESADMCNGLLKNRRKSQ
jgi:hypothetical protein